MKKNPKQTNKITAENAKITHSRYKRRGLCSFLTEVGNEPVVIQDYFKINY